MLCKFSGFDVKSRYTDIILNQQIAMQASANAMIRGCD